MRIGVLASGQGTNLRNLVERGFDVVAVATNKPSCGAAEYARSRRIPVGGFSQKDFSSREERDQKFTEFFKEQRVDLVVNAGYDRIHDVHRSFPCINIHPSLLPAFGGGMDAVEQALKAGVKITGCTVHIVDETVDAGPILVQKAVPVLEGDTVETLHQRIHEAEYEALPEAIRLMETMAAGRVKARSE